ncbi:hypothetical protein COY27_05820 [Candidatus Woesearchaeota archaeon CG_4_10_14_0_2_um_filter_33_13]|nr:MAG: hypothetical protein COY27_05820 [Candidatus Woesearchaeota archaeon CG_4_10_14_0_2_um_filter_33_13]
MVEETEGVQDIQGIQSIDEVVGSLQGAGAVELERLRAQFRLSNARTNYALALLERGEYTPEKVREYFSQS